MLLSHRKKKVILNYLKKVLTYLYQPKLICQTRLALKTLNVPRKVETPNEEAYSELA